MEIESHKETYTAFLKLVKWSTILTFVTLLLLAIFLV